MHARIASGRTDLVFELIDSGASGDSVDADGTPLLAWCAYYGDVSAMKHLLAHGASLALLGDNFDLNGAAFHGHWRLCQFLLEQGADPNRPLADTGETPLHSAFCRAGGSALDRVVQVLLAAGAAPNRTTKPGVATGGFMRDCRTRGETPLHRAAQFATVETLQRLLDAGADREARDVNGDSPLSWASWCVRPPEILRLLCFPPHRLHPEYVPMAERLLGEP